MGRFKNSKFADFKRRAILDAATEEFTEKGLEKASMRAIAKTAGMTTGAIYTMFDGKEDIYAALLLESLTRLRSYVQEQTERADTPIDKVTASVMAFYDYYADRQFEVQLGMHSFSGLKHSSLGKDRDELLNSALLETLNIIAGTLQQASKDWPLEKVTSERNAIFSSLMGALSLAHTGRAESIGTNSNAVMKSHIDALLLRLS